MSDRQFAIAVAWGCLLAGLALTVRLAMTTADVWVLGVAAMTGSLWTIGSLAAIVVHLQRRVDGETEGTHDE